MPIWIVAQTQAPPSNIVDAILNGVASNPSLVTLAVALIVFYFATRAMTTELRESRKMLNNSQTAGDQQENKALDMATNAINKMDRVADSITDMARSMRESSSSYFASAQLNADAHVKTTNMLIDRIAAMDKQRAEDEMYANGKLLVQIDEQLNKHKQDVGMLVGTILNEAVVLHKETRDAFHSNNGLILEALRATPPPMPAPAADRLSAENSDVQP